jgi:hypothetical protein
MKLQRLLFALLTALLLFAQQGALAHAVTHLDSQVPAKEQLGHNQLCGKCVSFEKLSAAAPFSLAASLAVTRFFAPPDARTNSFRAVAVVAFRSRAPPALS